MIKTAHHKGFTLVELLVVLAITGTLLGLSVSGFRGYQNQQYGSDLATKILSSIQKTRNFALNSYVSNATDPYPLGYVYSIFTASGNNGYCINEWVDTGTTDPNQTGFTYNGNLTAQIAAATPITMPNIGTFPCPTLSTGASTGYITLDHTAFSFYQSNTTFTFGSVNGTAVSYIVFENLSGKAFAFDATGKRINPNSNSVILSILLNGSKISSITVPLETNNQPYTN